jgi:uncharacterized protein
VIACLAAIGSALGGTELSQTPPNLARTQETRPSLQESVQIVLDYEDEGLRQLEVAAFTQGPYEFSLVVRSIEFLAYLFICAVLFIWRIAAMFLIGAALMKTGFFSPDAIGRQRRFALGFGFTGFTIEVAAAIFDYTNGSPDGTVIGTFAHFVAGVMLVLGYVGVLTWIASSRPGATIIKALAATGRLALTNYVGQSLVCTTIMLWYGFGLYGATERFELLILALAIYTGNITFSVLWLLRFRMGPFEWLWRSITHGKAQPLRRHTT